MELLGVVVFLAAISLLQLAGYFANELEVAPDVVDFDQLSVVKKTPAVKIVRCTNGEDVLCRPYVFGCPEGMRQSPVKYLFDKISSCDEFEGDIYRCVGGSEPYCYKEPSKCPYYWGKAESSDEPYFNFEDCCVLNGYEYHTKPGACFLNGGENAEVRT